MSQPEPPILYSFRRCPYAMRARMALSAAAVPCRLREVVLRDKPDCMLIASPKGTVPVLVLPEGRVIDQSLDIMAWALARHDPGRWRHPDHGDAASMSALIATFDGAFKHHLDRYKYASRYDGAEATQHRAAAASLLMDLEARLAITPELFGQRISLADMALMPFVRQFANTDRDWFETQAWPALRAWLQRHLDSPLFQGVMAKYRPWQPGDAEPLFPAADA